MKHHWLLVQAEPMTWECDRCHASHAGERPPLRECPGHALTADVATRAAEDDLRGRPRPA